MERLLEAMRSESPSSSPAGKVFEDEKAEAHQKLEEFREALHGFADRFSVRPEAADNRKMIAEELVATWLLLESCRPKRLRRNGPEIEPSQNAVLEEEIDVLVTKAFVLRGRFR
jgi:hypothetical protein